MISIVERVLFLKRIDLFSQIPGEFLAHVARVASEEHFDTGDPLMREGEVGDSLYLIVEGTVRVHKGEREIVRLGERECVGEMAILDSEPRSASVTAVQDTLALRIEREDFYDILNEKPEIARGVITVLTRRLRKAIT